MEADGDALPRYFVSHYTNSHAMSDSTDTPAKKCCPCPDEPEAGKTPSKSSGSEVLTLLLASGGVLALTTIAIVLGIVTYKLAKSRMQKMV